MTVLLMSGLQIFNAHPALYWGDVSDFDNPLVAISGFPGWATLPGSQWLAMGRRWHFFFAWGFVANGIFYTLIAIARGHLRRDLAPSLKEYAADRLFDPAAFATALPQGRGGNALQCVAEVRLPYRHMRALPADHFRRCHRNWMRLIPPSCGSLADGSRHARSILSAHSRSSHS